MRGDMVSEGGVEVGRARKILCEGAVGEGEFDFFGHPGVEVVGEVPGRGVSPLRQSFLQCFGLDVVIFHIPPQKKW